MNPNTKLLLVGLLLVLALAFYFLGEGLLDTAEAPENGTILPSSFFEPLLAGPATLFGPMNPGTPLR